MRIVREAVAGTLESSDVYVCVRPWGELQIEIESVVLEQYGDAIRARVLETARALGVEGCLILLKDRGALDCVIDARVEAALRRASQGEGDGA